MSHSERNSLQNRSGKIRWVSHLYLAKRDYYSILNSKFAHSVKLIISIFLYNKFTLGEISNGNRTEWSPIQSVIMRVITKSDDRAAGVRFVYHEYDYRPNWTTRSLITN